MALLWRRQPTRRLKTLNGTTVQISQTWNASSPIKTPLTAGKTDKIIGKARQCMAHTPEADIATLSAQPRKSTFNILLNFYSYGAVRCKRTPFQKQYAMRD
jgi:hypothetical protein